MGIFDDIGDWVGDQLDAFGKWAGLQAQAPEAEPDFPSTPDDEPTGSTTYVDKRDATPLPEYNPPVGGEHPTPPKSLAHLPEGLDLTYSRHATIDGRDHYYWTDQNGTEWDFGRDQNGFWNSAGYRDPHDPSGTYHQTWDKSTDQGLAQHPQSFDNSANNVTTAPDADGPIGPIDHVQDPATPKYGDGPDLDHNRVPDDIGINPDDMKAGHPGGSPTGPHYGEGPDLDHNGVPDDIGINPANLQPGYPGVPPLAQNPSSEPPLVPSSSGDSNAHLTHSDPFDSTSSPGPTLHPDLLDPTAPGPTLDHGLADQIHQNPQLVNAVNQDPDLAHALEQDPSSLEQVTQHMGLRTHQSPVEPSGVTDPSTTSGQDFHDPSLTDPGHTEPGVPDHGVDDHHLHT